MNKMSSIIREVYERWKAESPLFWKKIMNLSVTLGTAALGIILVDKQFDLQSLGVSPIIFTICGYVITFCGALGLASKLTKQDNGNN